MQEILIEDQLRTQLHIQDQTRGEVQPVQNRPNRPRKVKKLPPKTADLSDGNLEETISALKSEIDFMPMKTPISILQVSINFRFSLESLHPELSAKMLLINSIFFS